ncbi:MAG: glycosyltransferase [Terracidiphilus sp.]
MKITVILCTYNRCRCLAKALESLAAQVVPTSVQWEVLVVDNNSTDQTQEVVEEFSGRQPDRFRYLLETRQGKSYALNAGIRESRSEILAFTDDDAIAEPDWLWNLTSNLHDGEWAGSGGRIIPIWARPLPSWLSPDDPHTMGSFVAFDAGMEAGALNRPPYGANMAFRREAFERYGGFRTDLGRSAGDLQGREDIEFAGRLLARGERLRYEPGAVVRHPTPEYRMEKAYVLNWWFRFGYLEIAESGPPSDSRFLLKGVPFYLFRRLARWIFQWMISIYAPRRFACKRNVWYLAGIIRACYERPRCQKAAAATDERFDGQPKQRPLHIPTPK